MSFRASISYLLFGFVALIGCGSTSIAQNQFVRIHGKVTDKANGEPMPGTTVRVKDAPYGAMVGDQGDYTFNAPADGDTVHLFVYFHEYFPQELSLVLTDNPGKWEYELDFEIEYDDPGWIGGPIPIQINAWLDRTATSGEMDQISSDEAERGGMYSTEQALNGIPGVRFDSRGQGGSRRLSIRGSVIRSPFGVQNIRAYLDEVPISSPDGSTPIEVLDVSNIKNMAVAKGPQGDQFGPGNGGVLHAFSNIEAVKQTVGASADFLAGSNGYLRWMAATGYVKDNNKIAVRYTGQKYAGYREQEANQKQMLFISASHRHKSDHTFQVTGWHYDGTWELPGALTAVQAEEDPLQAVPFAIDAQARVNRKRTRIIGNYTMRKSFQTLKVSLYGNRTGKINPYGTSTFFQGYKDEIAWGGGGRSTFFQDFNRRFLGFHTRLLFGAEYQTELNQAEEFDNNSGTAGTIRTDQRILARQSLFFAGLHVAKGSIQKNAHYLTLISSLNQVSYTVTDLLQSNNVDNSASPNFNPSVLPSLTYVYKRSAEKPFFKVQSRLSTGYSPPSIAELRRDDGSIATDVVPEKSMGIEVRPALFLLNFLVKAEFSAYAMQIRDAILPQQLPSTEYVYRNAGTTRQNGLEAHLSISKPSRSQSTIRYRFNASAAFQDYRFSDYTKDSTDLSGNRLPGAPQVTFSGSAWLQFKRRLELTVSSRYNGRTWADDLNTVSQTGYWLFDGQLSFHIYPGSESNRYPNDSQSPMVTLLAGCNNILDQQYTNFLALNAFGGRYWNPAPGRNVFGGIQFRF